MIKKLNKLTLSIPLMCLSVAFSSMAQPPETPPGIAKKGDDYQHPLGKKKRENTKKALEAKLQGKAKGKVHKVAKGQYVELEREGEELIWTVLAEFSDFAHNNIAQPDENNNTTIWREDFSQQHYQEMLFSEAPGANSMRNFYIELSSNRYTVNGDVTDWVTVPGDAASYDDDAGNDALWSFIQDSVDGWYQQQLDAGKSPAEIAEYLSKFDVWDRYDYDGDGNFNEPDGYIDHFQSVHAGEGEEAGGGALGSAAIWSHRWYANWPDIGVTGPLFNPAGGVRIGDTDLWIGDYTIEPENGGVGVFAHEYAHDLGLPDLYATQGGSNSTGFWTLMSSGSWLSNGTNDIGSKPGHMGAWEKFQLGWLNYEVAFAGAKSQHKLGPATANTKQAQGLFVVLPDKEVETQLGTPFEGEYMYYSGSGNNLNNVMYKAMTLPAAATLSAQVDFAIEGDWDYAYLVISSDGGANWERVETNLSTNTNPNSTNLGNGITGFSGGWIELTADLSAYVGDVMLGFNYVTDGAVVESGLLVDNINITGMDVDGAEMDTGWAYNGFDTTTGTELGYYFNAYVAEFRNYNGYDSVLEVGPYNFGFLDEHGDKVERFPYQDGLLISYWDSSQTDNNTPQHPGEGLILPIDAHPEVFYRPSGAAWYNRLLSFDSTFSLAPTDELNLHWFSVESQIPSQPAVNKFNDNIQHWNSETPTAGVKNPHTGTEIWIKSISAKGNFMQVQVAPTK
ncbi:immune inhibitor A domain-containing protein [Colwellia sp. MEBiC06753]